MNDDEEVGLVTATVEENQGPLVDRMVRIWLEIGSLILIEQKPGNAINSFY